MPDRAGEEWRRYYLRFPKINFFFSWSISSCQTIKLMAQLALNAKVSDTTKETPFFANFGKNPNLFGDERNHRSAQAAMERVETLKRVHGNITSMQERSAKCQNKRRKTPPQLKKGDKVYLLTTNLRTKKPSKKLDHVKVGPFFIKAVRGPINYELDLPKDTKIHPLFHISLLEPADPNTPIQETFHYETQEEDEFEVEKILDYDGQNYLIHWKGYPTSEDTWEPIGNLGNCRSLLQRFHRNRAAGETAS